MSEDALANYVDARSVHGDAAPPPADEETQGLVGTIVLAEAGLGTPAPSEEAERQSRERLVTQMQEGALSARQLHLDEPFNMGLLARIKRWLRGDR